MSESAKITIMAFLAALVVLASSASGACSSCGKEGDWGQSASAFLEGKPISDEPIVFTAKAARAESSQFEKGAQQSQGSAKADSARIVLQSINATPARVNSTGTARITAVFAHNGSQRQDQGEMQLSANAAIKNSAGAEVAKLILIKQSANSYSNSWVASVPPGFYSLDISVSSLEGAAIFKDALQIEVIGPEINQKGGI